MRLPMRFLGALALAFALAASVATCGQKGPLRLPDEVAATPAAVAPAAATSAATLR